MPLKFKRQRVQMHPPRMLSSRKETEPPLTLQELRTELEYATRSKLSLLKTQQCAMQQAVEIQMLLARLYDKITIANKICYDIGEQIFWHEQMLHVNVASDAASTHAHIASYNKQPASQPVPLTHIEGAGVPAPPEPF